MDPWRSNRLAGPTTTATAPTAGPQQPRTSDGGGGGSAPQETFLTAVRRGDTGELQRILQRWEVNVNLFDQEGQTALHQSCMDGNLEQVKLLVKFGADVKLANRDGWSALHIAAYGGHQDIALYLIANSRR